MESQKTETLKKIQSWISFKNIQLGSDSKHFYLQGDSLDDLSKYIISNAEYSVVISNPYVQKCSLSDTLIEASKKKIGVLLLTRPIHSRDRYYREKQEYHESLKSSNVTMAYHDNIHAKMVIVDECVAIVSSLNFTSSSSSGRAWEAGMVTIDPAVVNTVSKSLDGILESRDTMIQNPSFNVREEKYIDCKPAVFFSYLTEPDLIPVWNPLINRVERESTVPLHAGSTQLLHLNNSTIVRESYLTYTKNEKFSVLSVQDGNFSAGHWELVPEGSGTIVRTIQGSRYNQSMDGSKYSLTKKIFEKLIEKILGQLYEVVLSHVEGT